MAKKKAVPGSEKPDLEFIMPQMGMLTLIGHTFKGRSFMAGYETMVVQPKRVNAIMARAKQDNLTIRWSCDNG